MGVVTLPVTRTCSVPESAYLWSVTKGYTKGKKQFQVYRSLNRSPNMNMFLIAAVIRGDFRKSIIY